MGAEGAAKATFLSLLVLSGIVFFFSMRYTEVKWHSLKGALILMATLMGTFCLAFIPIEGIEIPVFLILITIASVQLIKSTPRLKAYLKR